MMRCARRPIRSPGDRQAGRTDLVGVDARFVHLSATRVPLLASGSASSPIERPAAHGPVDRSERIAPASSPAPCTSARPGLRLGRRGRRLAPARRPTTGRCGLCRLVRLHGASMTTLRPKRIRSVRCRSRYGHPHRGSRADPPSRCAPCPAGRERSGIRGSRARQFPTPHRIPPAMLAERAGKDEKGERWPTVGSRTAPGTPAAEHLASRARFRGWRAGRRALRARF